MERIVKFTAADGSIRARKFEGFIGPWKSFIEFLRNSYECEGYQCADAEETWVSGWERTHVFTKAGAPDKMLEYARVK